MSTGQQVRVGEGRVRRPASAKANLEVPAGTAGAARAGGRIMIRPLAREEVSPLGDIRLWA